MYTIPLMSARRVAVLTGLAMVSAHAVLSTDTSAGERRVGFAVLVEDDRSTSSADFLASVRSELAAGGLASPPRGELRSALEEPPGAAADDGLAGARKRLTAAREAYVRFDYDRALAGLVALDRVLLDREPTPALVALLVERHLLAGLVHEGRGRLADARRSFRAVHHLDPDRRSLDAGLYRPQVVALFAEAARADEQRAALGVVTEPAGARIWLDGKPAGQAPLALDRVAAGAHWVVAVAPRHRPRGALVELDPGRPEQGPLSLALAPSSPSDRARELRRAIAGAGERDRRAAAEELSRAADIDVLVLVRARGGRVERSTFDAASGQLTPWRAMRRAGQPVVAARPDLVRAPPAPPPASPSWYRTWWGQTLLVAGGVAVGGAVVYALTADGDSGYSIGEFCFAGQDC